MRYDGLQMPKPPGRPSVISRLEAAKEYRKRENRRYRVLCDYFHLLHNWKERYAPQPTDADWYPLFCEALQNTGYIEYLLDDGLLSGTPEERASIVREKELDKLERRISGFSGDRGSDLYRGGAPEKARGVKCPEELAM